MSSSEKPVDLYAPFPVQLPADSTPNAIEDFVTSKLSRTNDPKSIYANRVRGKHILLENPVKESRVKKKREEAKRKSKEEKKKRDRNEQGGREARAFRLDPSQAKYVRFLIISYHLAHDLGSDSIFSYPCITYGWATYQSSSVSAKTISKVCPAQPACIPNSSKRISTAPSSQVR